MGKKAGFLRSAELKNTKKPVKEVLKTGVNDIKGFSSVVLDQYGMVQHYQRFSKRLVIYGVCKWFGKFCPVWCGRGAARQHDGVLADRIASFSFRDIDDNMDEYSIGWVSVVNMFDAGFRYASFMNGDYVTLALADR